MIEDLVVGGNPSGGFHVHDTPKRPQLIIRGDNLYVPVTEKNDTLACPFSSLPKIDGNYVFSLDWNTLIESTPRDVSLKLHLFRLHLLALLFDQKDPIPSSSTVMLRNETFEVNGSTNVDSDVDVTVLDPQRFQMSQGFRYMIAFVQNAPQYFLHDPDIVWDGPPQTHENIIAFLRDCFDFDFYVTNFSIASKGGTCPAGYIPLDGHTETCVAPNVPSTMTLQFARMRLDGNDTPPDVDANADATQKLLHKVGTATTKTRDQYHTASAYVFTALGRTDLPNVVDPQDKPHAYAEVVWENLGFALHAMDSSVCPTVASKSKKLYKYLARAYKALHLLGENVTHQPLRDAVASDHVRVSETAAMRSDHNVNWSEKLNDWKFPGLQAGSQEDPESMLRDFLDLVSSAGLPSAKTKALDGGGSGVLPHVSVAGAFALAATVATAVIAQFLH